MAFVEVWRKSGRDVVALGEGPVSLGKTDANGVALADDSTVSRLHAVLERFEAGWCVRDLGSRNGTFVNGERVLGSFRLNDRDELRVGETKLIFRAEAGEATETRAPAPAPVLTRRERELLVELCRPVLSGAIFTQPANIREVAEALVISEAAVRQHLRRIYDKFDLHPGDGERRRLRLANEAIRRGAVSLADLKGR